MMLYLSPMTPKFPMFCSVLFPFIGLLNMALVHSFLFTPFRHRTVTVATMFLSWFLQLFTTFFENFRTFIPSHCLDTNTSIIPNFDQERENFWKIYRNVMNFISSQWGRACTRILLRDALTQRENFSLIESDHVMNSSTVSPSFTI